MNSPNKPRIQDVATTAGVSTATVSHVINGTRFVSEQTTLRVKKAVFDLGFYPSAAAQGLASRRSKLIGIVFSDISNPFFTSLYKAAEDYLTAHGYELILGNTGEILHNQEIVLQTMLARQIDGLIIAPTGHRSEMIDKIIRSDIPVVCIDRSGPFSNTSLVELDNISASCEAVSHLIKDGHRQIGIVTGLNVVGTTQTRLEGYKKALADNAIPVVDRYIINGQSRSESAYEAVICLMRQPDPPTALLTTNNLMTSGSLHAIRDLKLRCPQDIGLIGFDDLELADIFSPPLTILAQPTQEMGLRAAKIIVQRLKQGHNRNLKLKGRLVLRGSCSQTCLDVFNNQIKLPGNTC